MERVNYSGDSFLTGSAIAHALLQYAQALAQAGEAATVEIPMVQPDGHRGMAEVLVGPSSQLIATGADVDLPEIEDATLVQELLAKTRQLRRQNSPTVSAPVDEPDTDAQYYSEYGI
ncbi:hypothetical protein [Microbacterium sp. Root180]|uniref:hypothetical protein n=1 Tax=Microbacterium sp. Root180 TaxID=1736483 RepID=UPI0006FBAB7A|nr:hypothetical protein [Microbacterium sp. Root180]KRB38635.1 hypothetical protein ASD93_01335 [Microbacterium sp. Root180]